MNSSVLFLLLPIPPFCTDRAHDRRRMRFAALFVVRPQAGTAGLVAA